jgi:hypothetical protein
VNRKLNGKETNDVSERRNVREQRKSAWTRKTGSNAHDGKRKRMSRKSQKGENESKKLKDLENDKGSKARE